MQIARSKTELDTIIAEAKKTGRKIAFVPTMGALHEGHLSLVDIARNSLKQDDGIVAVSIFVNPTQFAPHEDFDAYPRNEQQDIDKLTPRGVNLVYLPRVEDLYPDGPAPSLKAGKEATGLETDFRPHFFDGVVTVVHRLFNQVKPDTAVFGEKDFQQLQVIREMVATQKMPVTIIGGATARDEYGLALSSRNAYLSEREIDIARQLNKILREVANDRLSGDEATTALLDAGFDKIDYITKQTKPHWSRVLVAAWLGKTRLIDNLPLA